MTELDYAELQVRLAGAGEADQRDRLGLRPEDDLQGADRSVRVRRDVAVVQLGSLRHHIVKPFEHVEDRLTPQRVLAEVRNVVAVRPTNRPLVESDLAGNGAERRSLGSARGDPGVAQMELGGGAAVLGPLTTRLIAGSRRRRHAASIPYWKDDVAAELVLAAPL